MTDIQRYTYRVSWSDEDNEFVATVVEFPSLSWLHPQQGEALSGLVQLVEQVVADLETADESVPEPIANRRYSGKFNVRVPESLHRELALTAAEEGISCSEYASALGPKPELNRRPTHYECPNHRPTRAEYHLSSRLVVPYCLMRTHDSMWYPKVSWVNSWVADS